MSEYQYYEFQSIDRRLDEKEMRELRAYSSRAQITATSFTNEYSYGNFKGDANAWMEKYFDAYLYLANWGTRELQLRVSSSLLSLETARLYCQSEWVSVREKSGKLIFTFLSEDEGGGGEWIEGKGILSSLIPLRDGLMRGDFRVLYLGWLLSVQAGGLDDDSLEPPVPANLQNLTGSLSSFADFLQVDPDLLTVAAEASPDQTAPMPDRKAMAAWIGSLPTAEKDALLVRILEGSEPDISMELRARFNRQTATAPTNERRRRTVGELLAAADTYAEKRHAEQSRKAAMEKAERERQAALVREKHLNSVASRVPELWSQIEELLTTKQPKSYDLALQHLLDLRDVARRDEGGEAVFAKRVASLREYHSRKPSFLSRLTEKGL